MRLHHLARSGFVALLLAVLATHPLQAQTPADHPAASPKRKPSARSSRRTNPLQLEDTLARAFEAARAARGLRHLTRIADRPALRQLVCTAAITGDPPHEALSAESEAASALFLTAPTTALPQAAASPVEYDDRATGAGRKVTRYSIAVQTSVADPGKYWVGIALYWPAWTEFFAAKLSKSFVPPDLSHAIAPDCAHVR